MSVLKVNVIQDTSGTSYIENGVISTIFTGNVVTNRITAVGSNFALNIDSANSKLTANVAGFTIPFDFNSRFANLTGKTRVTYSYNSGNDTNIIVPAGVNYMYAKVWAGGGGGGSFGGWSRGSYGGAGGHSRGIIPVTPGETLAIRVPRGGYNRPESTGAPYGGGAKTSGSGDNQYGGGGGGYCGIFRSGSPLLMAGGGGGGGSVSGREQWSHGGGGGGLTGEKGLSNENYAWAGGGGTQTAGGAGGTGSVNNGQAGSSLQGGHVFAQGTPAVNGPYGGGGGGGYYGGGAGSYQNATMGGGGGGSGYVSPNVLQGETFTADGWIPPYTSDPDFPQSGSTYTLHAYGGVDNAPGGDGFVVIYY